MTRQIEIRPAAQADLLAIGQYTEAHWGREQARSHLGTIARTLDRIADNPTIGSDQRHLAQVIGNCAAGRTISITGTTNGRSS